MRGVQRLTDRVAIVTGGAQGIGGATARRLAEDGARVLVADLDGPLARQHVETICLADGTAEAMQADVAVEADMHAVVTRAIELWGRLDILVNNAYNAGIESPRVDAVELSEQ